MSRADMFDVLEAAWTFRKGAEELTLSRRANGDRLVLIVAKPDGQREMCFSSDEALHRFQSDMESFLVRTGWSLASFSPERRSSHDRRSFPRETNDRRRWWTDATSEVQLPGSKRKRFGRFLRRDPPHQP
jgi:hypothetical protein